MNVADVLLKVLAANGVRHLFGIPGDAINTITDAVRRQDEIEFVQVRHEEAGAFAASAQAKLTGRLAACVGTAGPGAIHLLNGLYDAHLDHAPVLAITGQVATRLIGTQQHQEVSLEKLYSDVTVYSQIIVDEDQVPLVLIEACRAALEQKGVAHVSLPMNIASRSASSFALEQMRPPSQGRMPAHTDIIDKAATMIDHAEKIVFLAGVGCLDARSELLELAERLQAPIIRSLKAKEIIDDNHPLCIGGLGLLGARPAVRAINDCDLLIMVGTDFPYQDFYPKSGKAIQIDLQATRIGKRHPIDIAIVADARKALTALLSKVKEREEAKFLSDLQKETQKMLKREKHQESSLDEPIAPPMVMATLSDTAPENALFTCDTGTVTAWAARHLRLKARQRFILSGNLATMAFAFPAAIGAQLAYPDRPVFALCGDGAFTMLMGELATAVKYKLPVTIMILNNRKLSFITLEQEATGLPDWGTELENIDFVGIARACGANGATVEKPDQLRPALEKALSSEGPTVIDIAVDPKALIMPPQITLSQAKGFTLAKLREFFGKDE